MKETTRVKELRELYGIYDSRHEFTEEEIHEISQRKIRYIYAKDNVDEIIIDHTEMSGYVSQDSVIFIKNPETTGTTSYIPGRLLIHCEELAHGIYYYELDNEIYCTNNTEGALEYSLEYLKRRTEEKIQDDIFDLEEKITELESTKIIIR